MGAQCTLQIHAYIPEGRFALQDTMDDKGA